eukprot:366311-Chlamydomonas_euryale.AAC.25
MSPVPGFAVMPYPTCKGDAARECRVVLLSLYTEIRPQPYLQPDWVTRTAHAAPKRRCTLLHKVHSVAQCEQRVVLPVAQRHHVPRQLVVARLDVAQVLGVTAWQYNAVAVWEFEGVCDAMAVWEFERAVAVWQCDVWQRGSVTEVRCGGVWQDDCGHTSVAARNSSCIKTSCA